MPWLRWLLSHEMGCPGERDGWPLWLKVVFHGSNLIIAVSDFAVPAVILYHWKYRREGITSRAIWTVLAYFPVKALSRLVRAFEIGGAPWHLAATLDAATAVLSAYAALQLGPFLRHVLLLPSRRQIHDLNDRLQTEVLEKEVMRLEVLERNRRLLAEVERARHALDTQVWLMDKRAALDRLAAIIKEAS